MIFSNTCESIQRLDEWITQKVDFDNVKCIDDLGFKQLNDLLFCKYFHHVAERMLQKKGGDDFLLGQYKELNHLAGISELDVNKYFIIVQEQVNNIPSREVINSIANDEKGVLFQNLIMLAFTLERWGQFVLKHEPGNTVRSIYVYGAKESLHEFLVSHVGNYNTLERFAITSISEVEGLYIPRIKNAKLEKNELITAFSPYVKGSANKLSRFPSILKLDDFPLVIKKGELIAQGYNIRILELMELLEVESLSADSTLHKVIEITELFKSGTTILKEFLRSPYFNEDKFIFILRQHTVELSLSPSELLLENLSLTKQDKRKIKGIVNNYLIRTEMNGEERHLFLTQVLSNENINDPVLTDYIKSVLIDHEPFTNSTFETIVKNNEQLHDHELLSRFISELLKSEVIGLYRIKYALNLAAELLPSHEKVIDSLANDTSYLENKIHQMVITNYMLPPSGANSIAYFGPDVLLGYHAMIPNYALHMLNRLNVMIPEDNKRFWEFQKYIHTDLTGKLQDFLTDKKFDKNASIEEFVEQFPWIIHYVKLYNNFALMASTHDGIIEKYIRRLSKSMNKKVKDKLVSSPDHGTTYMNPNSLEFKKRSARFPSLDAIASVRRNHLFKLWIKPIKALEQKPAVKKEPVNWFYARVNEGDH